MMMKWVLSSLTLQFSPQSHHRYMFLDMLNSTRHNIQLEKWKQRSQPTTNYFLYARKCLTKLQKFLFFRASSGCRSLAHFSSKTSKIILFFFRVDTNQALVNWMKEKINFHNFSRCERGAEWGGGWKKNIFLWFFVIHFVSTRHFFTVICVADLCDLNGAHHT